MSFLDALSRTELLAAVCLAVVLFLVVPVIFMRRRAKKARLARFKELRGLVQQVRQAAVSKKPEAVETVPLLVATIKKRAAAEGFSLVDIGASDRSLSKLIDLARDTAIRSPAWGLRTAKFVTLNPDEPGTPGLAINASPDRPLREIRLAAPKVIFAAPPPADPRTISLDGNTVRITELAGSGEKVTVNDCSKMTVNDLGTEIDLDDLLDAGAAEIVPPAADVFPAVAPMPSVTLAAEQAEKDLDVIFGRIVARDAPMRPTADDADPDVDLLFEQLIIRER